LMIRSNNTTPQSSIAQKQIENTIATKHKRK